MATEKKGTEYLRLKGKVAWAKIYDPDEFRGAVRWTMNFYPADDVEWDKFKKAGIQKKVKEDELGKFFAATRPTNKLIKQRIVNFTPPMVYNKEGQPIIFYVKEGDEGQTPVRSYEGDTKIERVGEPILIGNGSEVEITLSVYQTSMGPGNRLEAIKLVDLITYEPEKKTEEREQLGNEQLPPW